MLQGNLEWIFDDLCMNLYESVSHQNNALKGFRFKRGTGFERQPIFSCGRLYAFCPVLNGWASERIRCHEHRCCCFELNNLCEFCTLFMLGNHHESDKSIHYKSNVMRLSQNKSTWGSHGAVVRVLAIITLELTMVVRYDGKQPSKQWIHCWIFARYKKHRKL